MSEADIRLIETFAPYADVINTLILLLVGFLIGFLYVRYFLK